jgi:integrase
MAIHTLTKTDVKRIRKERDDRDHHDGGGLILRGNRWFVQYTLRGAAKRPNGGEKGLNVGKKRTKMMIGLAHLMGLDAARERAKKIAQQVKDGFDPKAIRGEELRQAAPTPLFIDVAREFIAKRVRGVPRHVEAYYRDLIGETMTGKPTRQNYAAALQKTPIDKVTTETALAVLEPIWEARFPTADRMRGRLEDVFAYARGKGLVPAGAENPFRWKGHLDALLPARKVAHTVESQPMIPWPDAPALMAEVRTREGLPFRAMELTMLVGLRTGDVIGPKGLKVGDVDIKNGTLTATKTKMGWPLVVPLAPAAATLLDPLTAGRAPTELVFKLRDDAMRKALAAMVKDGVKHASKMTVHGLRRTIRSWGADVKAEETDVLETILAHKRQGVMAVYNNAQMIERRRRVLERWARYLNGEEEPDNVVALKRA